MPDFLLPINKWSISKQTTHLDFPFIIYLIIELNRTIICYQTS